MATDKIATMKTSALAVGLVTGLQIAETPMALIHAAAIPVSVVMVSHVTMWMNAQRVSIIVTQKLTASIPEDHTVVPARKDIVEMAGSVRLLPLDGPTHSLDFFHMALLLLLCCTCFVRRRNNSKLQLDMSQGR